jgi:hypothetical protein
MEVCPFYQKRHVVSVLPFSLFFCLHQILKCEDYGSNVTIPLPEDYLIIPSFVSPENAIFAEQPHDKVAKDLKLIFTKT